MPPLQTPQPIILAVIKETLRLHSPFPTAFPRIIAAGAETAIPNLAAPLPVGSLVTVNIYVLGRSKEIWGNDADKWKPERWLRDKNDIKRLEDKFVVFSKGPRGWHRQRNGNAGDREDDGWRAGEVGSHSEGVSKRG